MKFVLNLDCLRVRYPVFSPLIPFSLYCIDFVCCRLGNDKLLFSTKSVVLFYLKRHMGVISF